LSVPNAVAIDIHCRNVTVSLSGSPVLTDVSFEVAGGAWLTIIGPNGAGKTTLLRVLSGLIPYQGNARLSREEASELSVRTRAQRVALVPQTPLLPEHFTVSDYVLLGRTAHIPVFGIEKQDDLDVVEECLSALHLLPFARRQLSHLSGGERQRAVIARCLAQQAPLLLLDEPTASLDVGHQQQVLGLIGDLQSQRGLTIVSTMHDLTLAGLHANQVLMLHAGRVVALGTADEVITEENIERYYDARVRVQRDGDTVVVIPRTGRGTTT